MNDDFISSWGSCNRVRRFYARFERFGQPKDPNSRHGNPSGQYVLWLESKPEAHRDPPETIFLEHLEILQPVN